MIVTLQLKIEKEEFRRLQNKKEEAKILGKAKNWEDYLLKLAGVRRK